MWKTLNAFSREHLTQPGVMNKEGIAEQKPPEVALKEQNQVDDEGGQRSQVEKTAYIKQGQ